jgi:HlyD family secretion protein
MNRYGFALIRWLLVLVAIAGLAAAAWFGYALWVEPKVTVTEVVSAPVVQAFYATGTLLPDREYPIKSNVEGTIDQVLVDKGERVAKGQKLAVVRVEEYLLKHVQAQADLELKQQLADPEKSPTLLEFDARYRAAQEQFLVAEREYERVSKLREKGSSSVAEFDKAGEVLELMRTAMENNRSSKKAKQLELERDVKVAKAALDIAQWNLDQQTITSPIDGYVLDRPTTVGTRVPINGHLMQIADVSPGELVMRANVDEEDKTRISIDQRVKVTLYAYEKEIFEGKVTKVYPKADPDRRTFEVDITIDPPDPKFSAGMTGELAFIVAEKAKARVVPTQAVREGKVWVLRGTIVTPAEVAVGLRSIERTEILTGVDEGDLVVVSPTLHLVADQAVRSTHIDPASAAGLNAPKKEQRAQSGIEKL